MFWTACPDAPLRRLSITDETTSVPPCTSGATMAFVVVLVKLERRFARQGRLHGHGGEDAAGEVAAHRHELDVDAVRALEEAQVAADLLEVLVLEDLVGREVVGPPAEMRGRGGLDAGAGGAGDGRHVDRGLQQAGGGQRQERQLDGRGEAAGVGDLVGAEDPVALPLGQAVDIALGFVAVVLRQVHHLQAGGPGVLRPEFTALAVGRAEEEHVDGIEIVAVAEAQLRVPEQAAVDVVQEIAGVAGRVHEDDLHLRMVDQDAEQFACRVAGAADDADLNHCL